MTTNGTRSGSHRLVVVITALNGLIFVVLGAWAFFWPESFHEDVGNFIPFNLHYTHDAGAFQVGIGVALLAALLVKDALLVGLAGGFTGSAMHAISHIMDHDPGGRSSDPWTLSVLAVSLLVALVLRFRSWLREVSAVRAGS